MTEPSLEVVTKIRRELLKLAQNRKEDFQAVLQRYALERLLYRLSRSPYSDRFVLKGAMLFSLWSEEAFRATRDVDFLAYGASDPEVLCHTFEDLCDLDVLDDGLWFQRETVRVDPTRRDQDYDGVRVKLLARLGTARITVQADVGFGDVITPGVEEVDYPVLLDQPAPRLRAYPKETVIAEKLQAMVHLGEANSRMKDFYDLWVMARIFDFSGELLSTAIAATFERRKTEFSDELPIALSTRFFEDDRRVAMWHAFFQRSELSEPEPSFKDVGNLLRAFLGPVVKCAGRGEVFCGIWSQAGPWVAEA